MNIIDRYLITLNILNTKFLPVSLQIAINSHRNIENIMTKNKKISFVISSGFHKITDELKKQIALFITEKKSVITTNFLSIYKLNQTLKNQ